MSPASAPRARTTAAAACAHCGQPVPAALVRAQDAEQFCCAGCRQVYTLVREWGFDQYYRLVDQQRAALEPARVSGRSFEDFDDPQVQDGASDTLGDERRRTRLYLEGVHCAACVWLVEKLPAVLAGVDDVRLNYGSAVAEVTWRPAQTRLSTIGRALDRLGYTPHVHQASRVQDARRAEDRAALARLGVAAACAMNLMFLSGALYAGDYSGMASQFQVFFRWFSLLVAVPVLTFSARPFFQTAIAGLRAGLVHIDLPIAVGLTIGALASAWNVVIGSGPVWFDSLAMLTAALLGARQLQRSAQRAALERADSLRGVAFLEFARRLEGDGPDATSVEVPLAALTPGDRVEVRSGELVPVDGVVLVGRSSLDNAVITGESVPVPVDAGDTVHAGATNVGARLIVRVDAAGARTRVGALLAVVQDALAHKPAVLQATDAMARRFVKALFVVALGALAYGFAVGQIDTALTRVVALLVVSCPCALGLSVPLAMSIALMRAARAGIFVKNPDALDRLRHVHTVLLDKTGTLTEGRACVVRYHGDEGALELARALEQESSHPVARAFQHANGTPLHLVRTVDEVVETPGLGIRGRLDGHDVRVGSVAHVTTDRAIVPADVDAAATTMLADGMSPIFVSIDGRIAGVAGLGDALRPDVRRTVDRLRARGVHVRIVSGDHPEVVARIGAELGLEPADVHGGLTPEAKRDYVQQLVSAREGAGSIVMVGDGVNDAAALALADVGVAVHGGMGATIVAADIVLTREGVRPLLDIMEGSRRLRGIIRRNIGFSLAYNATVSTLALAGLVGPLLAAVLMPLSSLTVVLSSTATRTFARPDGRLAARASTDPLGA
ncbi:MAG: heavy metal translocating P-type ATPase [Acidobacteria bacterium]|nr:heavy metal translocating P-type ATPase [Acidobacteriota bacterium]